jgi:hypothetical protein
MGAPVAGVPITTGSTYNTLPESSSSCSDLAALEAQKSDVLRQDVNLLNNEIIPRGAEAMRHAVEQGFLDPVGGRVDWVFPHISSFFFYDQFADLVARDVLGLPRERIWTNRVRELLLFLCIAHCMRQQGLSYSAISRYVAHPLKLISRLDTIDS